MAYAYPVYPSASPVYPSTSPVYPSADPYNQLVGVRRYQIRQRVFSLVDKFTIKDELGQDVFTARAKPFSHGRRLVIEDMAGNGLIKIHRTLLRLHRTYSILSARESDSDRQLAVVQRKFSLLPEKFSIDSVYGEYYIEGLDIRDRSFVITKQGRIVATISKKFFSLADAYGVEVAANEDQSFILALAIIIDQVIDDKH